MLLLTGIIFFVVLWIYSFISVIKNDFKKDINKIVWIVILIFMPISAFLYPFIGIKQLSVKESNDTNIKINSNNLKKLFLILLNILAPGLGYMYINQIKKAIFFMIGFPMFVYISLYITKLFSNSFISFVLILSVYLYVIVNSFKINTNNIVTKKWYIVVFMYILSVIYVTNLKIYFPIKFVKIPSVGMTNTIIKNDTFIVYKHNFKPKRGNIILFYYPLNPKIMFLKRCVAKEGDILFIKNKQFYLNIESSNTKTTEFAKKLKAKIISINGMNFIVNPYSYIYTGIHHDSKVTKIEKFNIPIFNYNPIRVDKNSYFVLGDNRDHSADSRFWGLVPQKYVIDKVNFVYLNLSKLDRIGKNIK